MSGVVTDTHAIIWYLSDDRRLSANALRTINSSISSGDNVYVPSISLVEMVYLVEKNRIPKAALEQLWVHLVQPGSSLSLVPLDGDVVQAVARISSGVRDMPDRIIAATALHLGLPLVSRDRMIQSPGLEVLW